MSPLSRRKSDTLSERGGFCGFPQAGSSPQSIAARKGCTAAFLHRAPRAARANHRECGVSSCHPYHAGKATPCRKEVDFAVSRRREALRKASPRGKVVRLLFCTALRARLARTTANAAFLHATPITQEKRHPVGYRFSWWEEVDSNHRSRRRQIYSLIHLAALESSRI